MMREREKDGVAFSTVVDRPERKLAAICGSLIATIANVPSLQAKTGASRVVLLIRSRLGERFADGFLVDRKHRVSPEKFVLA